MKAHIPLIDFHEVPCREGKRKLLGVVKGDALPRLPIDGNLREPRRNYIVQGIIDSIRATPEYDFAEPLHIAAKSVRLKQKGDRVIGLDLTFDDEGQHGLLNGGHRQHALILAPFDEVSIDQVTLPIVVYLGYNDEELTQLCIQLNSSRQVSLLSKMSRTGQLDFLIDYLEEKGFTHLVRHENDSRPSGQTDGRNSVTHAIQLLACLDLKRYDPDRRIAARHPNNAIRSGKFLSSSETLARTGELLHLFPDTFWVEKKMHDLVKQTVIGRNAVPHALLGLPHKGSCRLMDGTFYEVKIPETIAFLPLSGFRSFIKDDDWIIPFQEFAEPLTAHLWNDFLKGAMKSIRRSRSFSNYIASSEPWDLAFLKAEKFRDKFMKERSPLKLVSS